MPTTMMRTVVTISGQLARLCRKGIRLVRMTWMISVCVSSDSTNQPVWNSDVDQSEQLKTYSMMKKVV